MTEQFANFAVTTTAAAGTAIQTTIAVADPSSFPLLGNFRIVVQSFDPTTQIPTSGRELMLVTGVAGKIFTVQRGIEGTTAIAFASGAQVAHIVTAAVMASFGGGALPSIAAYSTLSNNTNSSAVPTAAQQFILGTPGYAASGYNFAQWTANNNSYAQISLQNSSTGSSASSDFVVTANDGSDTTHYADFGINNSNGGGAAFTTAHAAYVYSTDNELDFGALGASGVINFYTTGGVATPVKAGFFDASQNLNLTNALGVGQGGTGQSTYTDGQLLIGNSTGNTLTKASLTAGANITITPGHGSITIAASGGSGSISQATFFVMG